MVDKNQQEHTPIEAAFPIDSLVRPTLQKLGVHSLEDLAALEISDVAKQKGVGGKKLELIEAFIQKARNEVALAATDESSSSENEANQLDARLLFVPSLLKPTFERDGVGTVAELLALQPNQLMSRGGWGERKLGLLSALQKLYRDLATLEEELDDLPLVSLVAPDLLPDESMREMTVRELVGTTADELQLQGRHQADFNSLRRLFLSGVDTEESQETPASYLQGFEQAQMAWRDVPLEVSKRVVRFLDRFELVSLEQLDQLAFTAYVRCPDSGQSFPALEQENFGEGSLAALQKELSLLAESGLDGYRYGASGKPENAARLAESVLQMLAERDAELFRLRSEGLTLEEVASRLQITRERVRQLEERVLESVRRYRPAAVDILAPVDELFLQRPRVEVTRCVDLVSADAPWQFWMTVEASGKNYKRLGEGTVSRFSSRQVDALDRLVRHVSQDETFQLADEQISLRNLVALCADQQKWFAREWIRDTKESDQLLTKRQLIELIGADWLRKHVRAQLVEAGGTGLFFDEVDTFGVVGSAAELAGILGDEAEVLTDGRFRRPGEIYSKSDEIVAIVRQSKVPISAPEIIEASQYSWQQPVLVGRYLTALHEIITTDRGLYIHIEKLSLTLRDVNKIADWGAELLAGERKLIDGGDLFDLYSHSDLGYPVENAWQLVSIVAKHPDVRRVASNLQLAHRDSFEESELFLAATDPDLAAQWHPDKNGEETPETVRPTSTKVYWWQCEVGHEFEASPVYRTRMVRNCPGCQERWTLTKIRHFVQSLQKHLDAFTPAELYVIFQQSGLWQRGGKAKGFVKALATGRFPKKELDKFVDGEKSLVDEFLDDSDLELDQPGVVEDESIGETAGEPASQPDEQKEPEDETPVPQVRAEQALESLDSHVIASTDAEAAEFLLASAKTKIWSHAYQDEAGAVAEAKGYGQSVYAEQVREEFLQEYEAARGLAIPDGYAFAINGEIRQPNLMQRHVAVQVRDRLRYGNWSGTGAGKTLSAILATRVVDAGLTVVCCPNAVVGDQSDGWAREIRRVYPDSEIIVKTLTPSWSGTAKHRYLVLNYEQFQQSNSEALLKQFVESNRVDFIVIDEVHFAKQRFANQMSKRKRLIQAMVASAGEANSTCLHGEIRPNNTETELRVLGLSATPVINNLQEGRSLVEMITGVEHDDIATNHTVPNCMRLHQKLATLGTRWRPAYDAALELQTIDVDCSEFLAEIRSLGKKRSPLALEKILTRSRLPVILQQLANGRRSLIYTHYVEEIDRILYDAVSAAGYRVGFYTGELKDGLNAFKAGKLDVLIGSSAVGTGVDGLQYCCNQLIVNSLPWTNAEYEQLIGRLWRQGQTEDKVKIVVPTTFAEVNGERWSYCDSKLQRIRYKKSIADAAVDGAVPEGNLRSPAQAQQDIMAWLERLEQGEQTTISRRKIVVPLSGDVQATQKRQARYGDFSQMNNRWNQSKSQTLADRLRDNPEEWEQYHTLYRQAREHWAVVPVKEMIAWCDKREGYEIGDFGCGEALLAKAIGDRHNVYSFDHIAINDTVVEGDMADTPLDDGSLDVAVFSLSLMGANFTDYLREAHRVLKLDGHLHIWEATSRFNDVAAFCADLETLGFRPFPAEQKGQFTHIQAQKTDRPSEPDVQLRF